MGASFMTMQVDGEKSHAEIAAIFEAEQERDRYENGHEYSGGFGMARGLKFPPGLPFPTIGEANEWLMRGAQKWDAALCVKVASPNVWLIGAWCAS